MIQRNLPTVLSRLCFFAVAVALALLAPLRGQDEPVHMTPEFPLIFPLVQNGRDVTVKYPVMINPATVIKPGMVLRTLYVLSVDAAGAQRAFAQKGSLEDSFARDPHDTSNDKASKLPPDVQAEINTYRKTVWEVPNNFVLAMAQFPTDTMHLIYSPTGGDQEKDLVDERFSFFDGMFIGAPNGKVTVIAVEKESKAAAAGIKAGDEIISVGGFPNNNDLMSFAVSYSKAKKIATDNEVSSYAVTLRPGGTGEVTSVNIPMPPTIKSGLMDGFK